MMTITVTRAQSNVSKWQAAKISNFMIISEAIRKLLILFTWQQKQLWPTKGSANDSVHWMLLLFTVMNKDKVVYLFAGGAATHNGFATKGNGRAALTALLLNVHV